MGEVIFIIILIAGLVVPFAIVGLWGWFWTMLTVGIVVAIGELLSKLYTGRTLSQQFWYFSSSKYKGEHKAHPLRAWLVLGALLLGWIALLIHLAWKMITGG